MIDLGLSPAQWDKLNAILVDSHKIQVSAMLMTLSHEYVGDLTKRILSGQVDVDATAEESTRACSLELLDPGHELKLDGESPEDGSLYYTKMIKVIYSVISSDDSFRVDIPIFCGPLSKVERNGVVLSITAMGKEKLSLAPLWKNRTFKKKMKKTSVIRILLSQLGGEKKLNLVNSDAKLPKKMTVNEEKTAWGSAQQVARSMNTKLFYDGRGVAVQRRNSNTVMYTFRQRGALLSQPNAGFDAENVINCVEIIGGKSKKAKKKIRYRVVAPRSHPLSPHKMGRWDKPRYLPEVIEDDSIRSMAEARTVAKARLKSHLMQQVEVAFESLPIPYLEEGDVCRVVSDTYTGNFRLQKFSIPLTADGSMSVGYLKKVTPGKKKIKNKDRKRSRR